MTRKLVFINDSNKSATNSSSSSNQSVCINTTEQQQSISMKNHISPSSINNFKCSQSALTNPTQNIKTENFSNNIKERNISKMIRSNRLITTIEELSNLEARSRMPIDITNIQDLLTRFDDIKIQNNQETPISNQNNRKYFSFMTTNKQFCDLNRSNSNELKLKIINNQLVNDLNEVTEIKQLKHCFSSSSSTSSSASSDYTQMGLDSGCGSSIARSSIVEPIEESVKRRKAKTLTVLFDYETESKTSRFAVKKGDSVKVVRDYDEKFYLVATCLDNRIGFIPKEFTVDLNELKQRYKNSILSSSNSSFSDLNNSDENYKKLTHL